MKEVRYTRAAAKDLARHRTIAARVTAAMAAYALDPKAHANNVRQLVASPQKRMRVGEFRVLFIETEALIEVGAVLPRGSAHD